MSYTSLSPAPEIGTIIGSSFSDALDLTKKNIVPVALLIGFAALIGVLFALGTFVDYRGRSSDVSPLGQAVVMIFLVLFYVVNYYSVAAAVRTVNPAYRMTVGPFFGFFGYQLLVGLLTAIASFFLFIPGIWVGVKLTPVPFIYALTGGKPDALGESWEITTGYFWHTLGFMILLGLGVGAATIFAEFIGALAANLAAVTIIAFPAATAIIAWAVHVQSLANVRWTKALLDIKSSVLASP